MSKITKIKDKLYKEPPPTDFTWDELRTLLLNLGFNEKQGNGSRSEERRVGKECTSWCRSRWSPYH